MVIDENDQRCLGLGPEEQTVTSRLAVVQHATLPRNRDAAVESDLDDLSRRIPLDNADPECGRAVCRYRDFQQMRRAGTLDRYR